MNIFQCILVFCLPFRYFARVRTPPEIAQKTLQKWSEPTYALTQLLEVTKPTINTTEAACIIWSKIPLAMKSKYIHILEDLLKRLPVQARERAFLRAADGDLIRATSLLISLAPLPPEGLASLASNIKQEWDQRGQNDDLTLAFYSIAPFYGISLYDAVASHIRALFAKGDYEHAETVLFDVFARNPLLPPSDLYWSFIWLEEYLKRSPEQQIAALKNFIRFYPTDERSGQSWQKIGNLYSNEVPDYQEALAAYLQAEQRGISIPQLHAYRAGNWDAIPALATHQDYPFPPIVAIDLEVDPLPGASKGSRVFEVAAVRYKGQTCLEQYHSYIQRNFSPAKWKPEIASDRLSNASSVDIVAQKIGDFIGDAFVVGHNLCAFDAPELKGMGASISKERMIDTLTLARLLHPDSLHHNLALLCQYYQIHVDQAALHSALPDAQICAQLFHALGNSLLQRDTQFLTGIRALVRPGSALDRALLQPRQLPADPTLVWKLDPTPMLPHIITPIRGNQASAAMQTALQDKGDFFVEHSDFDGSYSQFLPSQERSLVAVNSRARIEQMLANPLHIPDVFVLPHPQTLLCSESVRRAIEASSNHEEKLTLFCLYQASHNHDADTLFPLRIPGETLDDPLLLSLRKKLIATCCSNEAEHERDCPSQQAVQAALKTHPILLSTHKNLLARQAAVPEADLVVLDDIADLQMHLAEYSAYPLSSIRLEALLSTSEEKRVYAKLETAILSFANAYLPKPGYRERLPLSSFVAYLEQKMPGGRTSLLEALERAGRRGEQIVNILQTYLTSATQKPSSPEYFHAYWIDLWFVDGKDDNAKLQRWEISGLSEDLRTIFLQRYWKPYKKHLLAGSMLALGSQNTQFLHRILGFPGPIPLKRDPRPKKRLFLPSPEMLSPTGFLQRRKWIMDVGDLLVDQLQGDQRIIMVTLNNAIAVDTLLSTFLQTHFTGGRRLLSPQLNWTMTKINDRMQDTERRLLVFAPPRLRQTLLASPVDLEVSGPLRFLNKRDPVVIAQMHVFAHLYPQEGPFHAYLLPQALLELKSRLSSDAKEHIICDSSLLSKVYRDEVMDLLRGDVEIQELVKTRRPIPEYFQETLRQELARRGLDNQDTSSDDDLYMVLRSIWDTDTFRPFLPFDKTTKSIVTQKEIVRAALEKKDQLVIAATGGGKSLCFQLPAIILADEAVPRVTLIFSPLIALMSNQVEQLHQKGIFSAIMLNSTLSLEQRQEHLEGLKKGLYSIVYLAPEQIYSAKLRDALRHREIGLIAIDEAHCLSQWGHNFRTDYFMLRKWIKQTLCNNQKREFPILALTATARKGYKDRDEKERSDQASTVEDIIGKLELTCGEDDVVMSSTIRPELRFHFEYITPTYHCPNCKHTYEYQIEIGNCPKCNYRPLFIPHSELETKVTDFKKLKLLAMLNMDAQQKSGRLPDLYRRWSRPWGKRQRGLIYCAYRKTTEEVTAYLQTNIPNLRISAYHAGLEVAEKETILQRFNSDAEDGLDVIVSTNAFGMGIDIRRLGFVIHFNAPATPEAYYQEAGRAGRDSFFKKELAECILLFHPKDLEKQRFLSGKNIFSDYEIEDVYKAVCTIYERNREHINTQEAERDPLTSFSQTSETLHVLASAQEIAMRAGVEEEQVDTLLYYLEEQTLDTVKKGRLLERGTTTNNVWRLKFETNYLEPLQQLPPYSRSWPLIKAFQDADEYRLNTASFTTISAHELREALHMSLKGLEDELLNLARRKIVTYEGHGQFKLNSSPDNLQEKLTLLGNDIKKLLRTINKLPQEKFGRKEVVTENIGEVVRPLKLNTVTVTQLTYFLFRYSLETTEPLRLLERFKRIIRSKQPDTYELQLWSGRNRDTLETIDHIVNQLHQTVEKLTLQISDQKDDRDWHVIDLFALQLGHNERRDFHRHLQLLEVLGFLQYISDPALGQAMNITLLQPPVPLELLEIDLRSLRMQERHANSKRKLMEQYVTTKQKEDYAEQFAHYFQGEKPLIEHNQHALRQGLTPNQWQIATLKDGIHVIKGPAGCGKTTVLAEHVKYLVNQQVPIGHIMITTHYRSAEGRIADALKELESEGETATCTTINSLGSKIFKQYRHLLLKPDGNPYYQQEANLIKDERVEEEERHAINTALKRCERLDFTDKIEHYNWPWPQDIPHPKFSSTYKSNDFEEERFHVAIHQLRQHGIFLTQPPDREELARMIGNQTGIYNLAEFYAVYMVFIQIMAEKNICTYDDQIVFALAILRTNPNVAHEYQRYFEHIIIDELQDFSPAKLELLMMICGKHKNIMAFGDVAQDIGFDKVRTKKNDNGEDTKISADAVFSRLVEQESCGINSPHHLTTNFRSTQEILDLCSYLLKYSGDKALKSAANQHGPKPVYLYTQANTAIELLDATLKRSEQLSPSEKESIAIIIGNRKLLDDAQTILRRRNIPFSLIDNQKGIHQLSHIKNVFIYLYLILNKNRDEDTQRLLRHNIVPYFDKTQINALKNSASKNALSLFETISSSEYLRDAKIGKEQQERLRDHLGIINRHQPEDLVSQVEQELNELSDGPLTLLQSQEEKLKQVKETLSSFQNMTINEAINEIQRHILFLDTHRGRSDLVLSSVEYAKSQEFETVFLLGVGSVILKRLYVSVSRAKQRLFIVGDNEEFENAFKRKNLPQPPTRLFVEEYQAKHIDNPLR